MGVSHSHDTIQIAHSQPNHIEHVGGDSTVKLSDAMIVVKKYFNGISTGNLEEILSCLDANLLVRYPEKSKGWSGIIKARKRYGNMLSRSPNIQATYVILDSDSERSFTTITATVRFQCR